MHGIGLHFDCGATCIGADDASMTMPTDVD